MFEKFEVSLRINKGYNYLFQNKTSFKPLNYNYPDMFLKIWVNMNSLHVEICNGKYDKS